MFKGIVYIIILVLFCSFVSALDLSDLDAPPPSPTGSSSSLDSEDLTEAENTSVIIPVVQPIVQPTTTKSNLTTITSWTSPVSDSNVLIKMYDIKDDLENKFLTKKDIIDLIQEQIFLKEEADAIISNNLESYSPNQSLRFVYILIGTLFVCFLGILIYYVKTKTKKFKVSSNEKFLNKKPKYKFKVSPLYSTIRYGSNFDTMVSYVRRNTHIDIIKLKVLLIKQGWRESEVNEALKRRIK